jgi:fibronectin-binding autotransporter adhesin
MKNRSYSSLRVVAALSVSAITFTHAAEQFWNPSPLSDDWADSVWSDTSGGGSLTTWTASNDAVFDQAGTYTATINADQTATNVNIKAGDVTFAGTNTAASNNLTIDSGASLTAAGDRFLKIGTTTLTVNGTLTQTAAVTNTGRRVSIAGGTGSIVLSGSFRTSGNFNFAGDISGSGTILTDGGGTYTLSGNNTFAGDMLIRNANTVRVGSATALSSNSFLRIGGGSTIELTGADFSRTIAGSGAGNMRVGHASDSAANTFGFAAVNADRTVALNGTVVWQNPGTVNFAPTVFNLGTAASTHKVTLTTGIDLGAATRTINTTNGSADVEAEISGSISGTGASLLTKTGTGVLLLSVANTHAGGTTIAGSLGAINPLRISHGSALGSGTLNIGSGGNNDQARLELTGGITVANTIATLTSRNNNAPNILNISGDNAINSNISVGGGGNRTTLQSDSGKLTMAGNFSGRQLNLFGAGDGEIVGSTTIATGNALVKEGNGTWTINAGNLNSTTATVTAGTLLVNGTVSNSSATVNGGVLGGTGSISGAVAINTTGVLSPGASIGTFGTGALSLNTGSTFAYELNTTAVTGDLLNVDGDLSFDGTVTLSLTDLGSNSLLALGSKFTLISYFGTWDGNTFSGFADDSEFALLGNEWRIDYNDVSAGSLNGGTYSNAVTLTVIPEPTTAILAGLGLLALLRRRR